MKPYKIKYYLVNCFVLLLPVIIWNAIFHFYLPEAYVRNFSGDKISSVMNWFEIIITLSVLIIPVFLPLKIKSKKQRLGLIIYFIGLIIYLFAWRPIILYPNGDWSNSLIGFVSLSLTPIIFLTGIGLIGEKLYLNITYHKSIYIMISIIFILIKTSNAVMLYYNIY